MRKRPPAAPDRVEAPLWTSQLNFGMKHFNTLEEWRQAQRAWCRDVGCHRPGTKTCEEAGAHPCAARRLAAG